MPVKQGNASRHDVKDAAQSPRSGSFLGGDRSVRPGARRRRDDGALCRGSVRLAFFKVAFSLRHGIRYMRKADDRRFSASANVRTAAASISTASAPRSHADAIAISVSR